jgi:hypothetical protein
LDLELEHLLEYLLLTRLIKEGNELITVHAATVVPARDAMTEVAPTNEFSQAFSYAELVRLEAPLKQVTVNHPLVLEIFLHGKTVLMTLARHGRFLLSYHQEDVGSVQPSATYASQCHKLNAFGSSLRPVGTYNTEIVLKHPRTPLRLRVSFLVLDSRDALTTLLLGINFIRAYKMDIVPSSGPVHIRVGHRSQAFPSLSTTSFPIAPATIQVVEDASPAIPFKGRPTKEEAAFETELTKQTSTPRFPSHSCRISRTY